MYNQSILNTSWLYFFENVSDFLTVDRLNIPVKKQPVSDRAVPRLIFFSHSLSVIADENDTLKAEAEKDKAEIELLKSQVNFLKKDTMAEKIVELSSTNKILIGENCRLKLEAEEYEIYQENANQNLEHHMYEYRYF